MFEVGKGNRIKIEHDGKSYLLTESQAVDYNDWINIAYQMGGCNCINHPPCAFCTHPGNILGLEGFIIHEDPALERDGLTRDQIAAFEPPKEEKPKRTDGEIRRLFRLPSPE